MIMSIFLVLFNLINNISQNISIYIIILSNCINCNFIFNTSDNGTKDVNKNNVDAVLKNLNEPFALEPKIMINQNAEKKCP